MKKFQKNLLSFFAWILSPILLCSDLIGIYIFSVFLSFSHHFNFDYISSSGVNGGIFRRQLKSLIFFIIHEEYFFLR